MLVSDQLQRPLRDLRISVTDRCNYRCRYCMPAEVFGPDYEYLPRSEILDYEEIARIAAVFVALGVRKLRITGGEPLLRRDLHQLISQLSLLEGCEDLALTTNGTALAQQAEVLNKAGLQRVTVSLDALDPGVFTRMNGVNAAPDKVIDGIREAQRVGLGIKINTVVQRGVNESEILPLVRFAMEQGLTVRFIEYMDTGETHGWNLDKVVPGAEIISRLEEQLKLELLPAAHEGETANRYQVSGSEAEVGLITSVTRPFCSSCNRARLTADGHLFTCLFATAGHDLKSVLRSGAPDRELADCIREIWGSRSDRYSEIRSSETLSQPKPEMSYLGG